MIYIGLILGFVCLIYGGDWLVQGAVKLARRLGVSPLLIGLTLVGFGTSTPELVTSLRAVFKESNGIAVGNVVGSNTANILLVLGVAAVISPVHVDLKSFKRDGSFLVLSTITLILAVLFGKIDHLLGIAMVGGLLFYITYSYFSDRKNQKILKEKEQDLPDKKSLGNKWVALAQLVAGIALTLLGARLLVDNASELARRLEISETIIGLTVVAVGTSLPELITSIMSAIHKQDDVAFGNVVGSNIYNALFILGLTAVFMPVDVPPNMNEDVWVMTGATAALIGIACWRKQFSRPIGLLFLVTYAIYVWRMF